MLAHIRNCLAPSILKLDLPILNKNIVYITPKLYTECVYGYNIINIQNKYIIIK